jgi:hypothetical protein
MQQLMTKALVTMVNFHELLMFSQLLKKMRGSGVLCVEQVYDISISHFPFPSIPGLLVELLQKSRRCKIIFIPNESAYLQNYCI